MTKRNLISCICLVALTVLAADLFMPRGEKEIYDNVVRLHILADSDSDEDQAVKLTVRDAIIESAGYLNGISDFAYLREEIVRIASEAAPGERISSEYGEEYYDTTEYDGVSFPAGTYKSLRIVIGSGEGHNWWCVLFPPLCLSAATARDALGGTGMTEDEVNVFTKSKSIKYRFRFRLLELFGL